MHKKISIAIALLLIVSVLKAQTNLQSGLIAYYAFNGNDKDQSGNSNHPVFNNTKLVADRQGNKKSACYFNGKDSYIRIKNSPSLNPAEITLVALVKPEGFYMGDCYNNALIDKGTQDFQSGNYTLRFTAGEYTNGDCSDASLTHQNFVGFAGRNNGATSKELYVKLNQWYCVVYTQSKTTASLYVNGRLISSVKVRYRIGSNNEDLFLGKKNHYQFPYWFNGILDEVRIYNRPLNQDEIKALCNLSQPAAQPKPDPCTGTAKPSAKFDYSITDCNTVNFRLLAVNTNNLKSIKWSFGDGKISAEKKPSHTYSRFGSFKVKAIVTNKTGCSDTITKEIKLAALTTDFVVTEKGEPGAIQFRAKNNKASYSWDFADGNTAGNETMVSHLFTTTGNYSIRMFAKNHTGCTDTVSKNIFVQIPEAPKENEPTIETTNPTSVPTPLVTTLEKREKDIIRTIAVASDSLRIALYDNGIIDGDSVTIIYNNNVLIAHQPLSEKPVVLHISVDKNAPVNELIMYADNIGTIPPNTALMVVYDGNERHTVIISSTNKTSGTVAFTRQTW